MSSVRRLVGLRTEPICVADVLAAVTSDAAGGTTVFVGTVRDIDDERAVERLDYAAHPGALQVLDALVDDIVARWPLEAVAAVHRVGELAVGDVAVVVAAAAAHREEAFAAARALIDELKATVPIWKRQHFVGGSREWTGVPAADC